MNLIRLVLLTSMLFCGLLVPTMAQPGDLERLCELSYKGKLKGVLSFRITRFQSPTTSTRLFVAAWFVSDKKSTEATSSRRLVIFEQVGEAYKEVFNLQENDPLEFRDFESLNSLTVPGIAVNFSSDLDDGAGPVLVVALVQDSFRIVYRGGTAEMVDLDGNGVPEFFESIWPDGDGYPKSTTIHVWNGTKYEKLITSSWQSRFSELVLNRVRKYEKTRRSR
jgi:hypothetical protein